MRHKMTVSIWAMAITGLLLVWDAHAYAVRTHQVLTLRSAHRSVNVRHFLEDMAPLLQTPYSRTFPDRAEAAFPEVVVGTAARDVIGAGSILEDADQRFFSHFYDPVHNRGLQMPISSVCMVFTCLPAPQWGYDGAGAANAFSWQQAFEYYQQGLTHPDPQSRLEQQERLFIALGHLIHLLQDTAQPSHTRNDPHNFPGFHRSLLEDFGEKHLNPTLFDFDVARAIDATTAIYSPTYGEFFDAMATWSNGEFFSDDTILKDYALPSTATTTRRPESVNFKAEEFVTSNNVADPQTGDCVRLARVVQGRFGGESFTLESPLDLVLVDNAEALVPMAVARAEGLLNHFFRGRIEVTLDDANPDDLLITNISETSVVNDATELVFTGGEFSIYYETVDGQMRELTAVSPVPVPTDLSVDGVPVRVPDMITALDAASNVPADDRRIVVVYTGTIGQEAGVAATQATLFRFVGRVFEPPIFIPSPTVPGARHRLWGTPPEEWQRVPGFYHIVDYFLRPWPLPGTEQVCGEQHSFSGGRFLINLYMFTNDVSMLEYYQMDSYDITFTGSFCWPDPRPPDGTVLGTFNISFPYQLETCQVDEELFCKDGTTESFPGAITNRIGEIIYHDRWEAR